MLLSLQMGFSFVRAAVACAIRERISGLEPSSETTAVHIFHNNLIIIIKIHDRLKVHKFHIEKPDSMFFEILRRLTFGQRCRN